MIFFCLQILQLQKYLKTEDRSDGIFNTQTLYNYLKFNKLKCNSYIKISSLVSKHKYYPQSNILNYENSISNIQHQCELNERSALRTCNKHTTHTRRNVVVSNLSFCLKNLLICNLTLESDYPCFKYALMIFSVLITNLLDRDRRSSASVYPTKKKNEIMRS